MGLISFERYPPKRSAAGHYYFQAVVGCMFGAVVATLLLANDQNHLRKIIDYLDLADPWSEPFTLEDRKPKRLEPPRLMKLSLTLKPLDRLRKAVPQFNVSTCRSFGLLSQADPPSFLIEQNGRWECSHLFQFPEILHEPSIFIQVRGQTPGRWETFRLKLNFGSLLSRQVIAQTATGLVDQMVGLDKPNQDALKEALIEGSVFQTTIEGVDLRYWQEQIDESRFNLVGSYDAHLGSSGGFSSPLAHSR